MNFFFVASTPACSLRLDEGLLFSLFFGRERRGFEFYAVLAKTFALIRFWI
jgi:hypothetical protein